jgi:ribonuclease T1
MSISRRRLGLRSLVLVPALATAGLLAPAATQATAAPLATGTICHSALPSQADDTLRLIGQGGPFPYSQDGQVFQNREGVLPGEPNGYYHEYTVKTPGSSTRGARRIVTARSGTDYYTSDHYVTFNAINFGC